MVSLESIIWITHHLVFQVLIELQRVLPVLSQRINLEVTFFCAALGRHEELVVFLRVVNAVFVGQGEKEIKTGTCRKMSMMNCRLWHHLEHFVERRVNQTVELLVVLTNLDRVVITDHLLSQLVKLAVNDEALIRKANISSCMVHQSIFLNQFLLLTIPFCLLFSCCILERLVLGVISLLKNCLL